MPENIPGGFGQITHSIRLAGDPEPMAVTYGVGPSIPDEDVAQEMVEAFHVQFGDIIFENNCWTGYTMPTTELRYHLDSEASGDDFHIAVNTAPSHTGLVGATPVPQNTAWLVHKRTAMAGRRYRGRFYLPSVAESAVDATGAIAGASLTGFQTNLNSFMTAINGFIEDLAGTGMYLFHNPPVGELAGDVPTRVTNLTIDPRAASQRRRLR